MNNVLADINTLQCIKRGVETGIEPDMIIELLDKVIELKNLQVTIFENQMEEEQKYGINCS